MLVPKLLLTPIKLGFLAQKRPNLAGLFGCAGCISQDTYLLYNIIDNKVNTIKPILNTTRKKIQNLQVIESENQIENENL